MLCIRRCTTKASRDDDSQTEQKTKDEEQNCKAKRSDATRHLLWPCCRSWKRMRLTCQMWHSTINRCRTPVCSYVLFRTTKNCLSIMTFTICLSVVIVTWGFVSLRGDRTPSFEEVWRPSQYLPNRQARSVHIPVSSR